MGKIKPGVPTGNLVLLTRPNSKGECTVYLRYFLGKYVKRSTGIHVSMKDWDERRQCLKASAPNAARINATLVGIKSEIDNRLLAYDKAITLNVLSYILNGGDPAVEGRMPTDNTGRLSGKNTDFVKYAHLVNDVKHGKKEYGYSAWYNKKKYIDAFDTFLRHYLRIKRFNLSDLNLDVFDRYIQYRFEVKKNSSKEAINKTLVPLYVAIKNAADNGIFEHKDVASIFNNYIEVRETEYDPDIEDKTVVRYLTEEQITFLKDYQSKVKNTRSKEILDFFFFSYYACGMRLSDIMTLEWRHIDFDRKVIKKIQFKTKRLPDVLPPINKGAMEILLRWKSYNRNSRFVFDLLPENYDMTDQKRLFKDRNSKDKTFNRSLNVARMTLRLPIPLTMHVARHSFAVMAINKGMSVFLLSKYLGHSSTVATEKTYAKIIQEKADNDACQILDL